VSNCDCGATIARSPTHSSWCETKQAPPLKMPFLPFRFVADLKDEVAKRGSFLDELASEQRKMPETGAQKLGPLMADLLERQRKMRELGGYAGRGFVQVIGRDDVPPKPPSIDKFRPKLLDECEFAIRGGVRPGLIIGVCCAKEASHVHVAHRTAATPGSPFGEFDVRHVLSVLAENCLDPGGGFVRSLPIIHFYSDDFREFERSLRDQP
jgi:hypothetical protein